MPNRILREGILSSERVDALSEGAEILYRRLMSVVDDYGRYFAHPTLIRSACWPLRPEKTTDAQIKRWMGECESVGLVMVYEVDGKPYLELGNFGQRTRRSKFPEPPVGAPVARERLADGAPTASHQHADGAPTARERRASGEPAADQRRAVGCSRVGPRAEAESEAKSKSNSEASAESDAGAPLASLPDTSGFDAAWFMYTSTGIPVNEQDRERAAKAWVVQNCDECVDAVLAALNEHLSGCADLVRNHEWRKIGELARWLERTPWTRRPAAPQVEDVPTEPTCCELCNGSGVQAKPGAPLPPDGGSGGEWLRWVEEWGIPCECEIGKAVAHV